MQTLLTIAFIFWDFWAKHIPAACLVFNRHTRHFAPTRSTRIDQPKQKQSELYLPAMLVLGFLHDPLRRYHGAVCTRRITLVGYLLYRALVAILST
ncbi:hypothetical protein ACQKWADRAFT_60620 [Trichoderma austrokoningii]